MNDLEARLVIVTICCPTIFCIIQPIGDISIVQLSQRLLVTLAPQFYSLGIGDNGQCTLRVFFVDIAYYWNQSEDITVCTAKGYKTTEGSWISNMQPIYVWL